MFICFKGKNNWAIAIPAASNAFGGWLGAKLQLQGKRIHPSFFFGGGGWDSDSFCL
jgi:hypothetical protein